MKYRYLPVERAYRRVLKGAERLVEQAISQNRDRADEAVDALAMLRSGITSMVLAAFEMAPTGEQRSNLLAILSEMAPPFGDGVDELLKRVARDDPEQGVREYAEDLREALEQHREVEIHAW